MKYLKYTDSFNSDYWAVYRWDEESKYGYLECCHPQNHWTTVAIFYEGPSSDFKYITEAEVDLLKLEVL